VSLLNNYVTLKNLKFLSFQAYSNSTQKFYNLSSAMVLNLIFELIKVLCETNIIL